MILKQAIKFCFVAIYITLYFENWLLKGSDYSFYLFSRKFGFRVTKEPHLDRGKLNPHERKPANKWIMESLEKHYNETLIKLLLSVPPCL